MDTGGEHPGGQFALDHSDPVQMGHCTRGRRGAERLQEHVTAPPNCGLNVLE